MTRTRDWAEVDFEKLADSLELEIGQAAAIAGVSRRQLEYWTDRGYVTAVSEEGSRRYDRAAIEKVILIRQGLARGQTLERARAQAEAFLADAAGKAEAFGRASVEELQALIESQAARIGELGTRVRRASQACGLQGELGQAVLEGSSLEKLVAYLKGLEGRSNTTRQLAAAIACPSDQVQRDLDLLQNRSVVERIDFPLADVYRYLPTNWRPRQALPPAKRSKSVARPVVAVAVAEAPELATVEPGGVISVQDVAESRVRPVDFTKVFQRLELNIGDAARICGVSIRQLNHWQSQGYVQAQTKAGVWGRVYDAAAIEKICLIKQALDQGYALKAANEEADTFLAHTAQAEQALEEAPIAELQAMVVGQADKMGALADRLRAGAQAYVIRPSAGQLLSGGLERVIGYFQSRRYERVTIDMVVASTGLAQQDVEGYLTLLVKRRFVRQYRFATGDIYRYLPR